ncbi:hypothetical protein HLH33_13795 [Gluconacetobacter diazotrophicus]|uniref:Alginate biosynthesis protein AlgF n=1 Tax=Gluconacetobacter diazotrophicus TaxID=33996 RepID=A0A7W4I723_GLUDI|nr:hypothetical protein [Gluconacetobacter diazotrophicus]MBB2157372.1 hypothetical protein [Gluconacetobacter diazotrophicus]
MPKVFFRALSVLVLGTSVVSFHAGAKGIALSPMPISQGERALTVTELSPGVANGTRRFYVEPDGLRVVDRGGTSTTYVEKFSKTRSANGMYSTNASVGQIFLGETTAVTASPLAANNVRVTVLKKRSELVRIDPIVVGDFFIQTPVTRERSFEQSVVLAPGHAEALTFSAPGGRPDTVVLSLGE